MAIFILHFRTAAPTFAEQAQLKFDNLMADASEVAKRVEHDMEALLQRSEKSKPSYRSIEDEPPFRREGPLTVGQPVNFLILPFSKILFNAKNKNYRSRLNL